MSINEDLLGQILDAAPELAAAPWLTMPIASTPGIDAVGTAQAVGHMANTHARDKALKRHKDHHGHGFFGKILDSLWRAEKSFAGVKEKVSPEELAAEAEAKGVDPNKYIESEITSGRVSTQGFAAQALNATTVSPAAVAKSLNAPLQEVQHQYRYLHDVTVRHGYAAMLAELGPIAAGAVAGGLVAGPQGAVLGGEAAGGVAGRLTFTDSWDRTKDHSYRDPKSGRPVNIGEDVATYLPKVWGGELKRGSAPYKTLAVVSGVLATFELDPVARVAGLARAPGGAIGGLQADRRILAAADVDRILAQSRSARGVFEDLASKPANQIAHEYPEFAPFAKDLGQADSLDAVASVFRDAFDQAEMTGLTVPRHALPTRPTTPIGLDPASALGDERLGKLGMAQRRATTRLPMVIDPETLKISNIELDPTINSAESFEAVRRVMRMGGLSNRAADGVVEDYINAESAAQRITIVRNGVLRSSLALLPEKVLRDPRLENEMRQAVTDFMGGISSGVDDLYGFDTMGRNLSKVALGDGAETAAGIWLNHRGPITLPNYAALQRWSREAGGLMKYYGRLDDFAYSRLIIPFKRLALLTGGFALRVGTAEGIPAVLRNGFVKTVRAGIGAKAAKLGYALEEGEAGHIAAAMEKVAGGADRLLNSAADRELAADIVMRTDGHFVPPALSPGHFITNDAIGKAEQEALNIFKTAQDSPRFRETDNFMSFGQGSRDMPLYWQRALREAATDEGVPQIAQVYRAEFLAATKEGAPIADAISRATTAAVKADREFLAGLGDLKQSAYMRANSSSEDPLAEWARTRVETFKGLTHSPDLERVRWSNDLTAGGEVTPMPGESAVPHFEVINHIADGPKIAKGSYVHLPEQDAYGQVVAVNRRTGTARVRIDSEGESSVIAVPLDTLSTQGLNDTIPREVLEKIPVNDRPLQVKGRVQVPDLSGNLTERIANAGHGKVLGPIINTLGREHQYFLAVKEEFAAYKPLIERGLMDEDLAMGDAMLKATRKVLKFVHNPAERTQLSVAMRSFAPFFFAQEQAYRRVGRLMADDPEAFVRYMRAVMGMRNYTHEVKDRTGVAQIIMPGLGFVDEGFVKAAGALGLPIAGTVPVSILGNVNSLNTILPFTEDNPLRPNWSPLVTYPAHILMDLDPAARRVVTPVIGETAAAGTAWEVLVPNTVLRNIAKAALPNIDKGAIYQSSMISVIQGLAYQQSKAMREWTDAGHSPDDEGAPAIVPPASATYRQKQKFIDRVKNQTRVMLIAKALISAGTPLAPSLAIGFPELSTEYQKYIAKYGIAEGSQKFLEDNPDATPYTISKSFSPQGPSLPPYLSAQKFFDENKSLFDKFPEAAAYFMPQDLTGEFDSAVYNEQVALGLRERKDAARWMDDFNIASGNHLYWDVDKPAHDEALLRAGKNKQAIAEENANWRAYTQGQLALQNPTWWDYFTSPNRENDRKAALGQIREALSTGAIPKGEQSDGIAGLVDDYDQHLAANERGKLNRWSADERDAEKDNWQSYLDSLVAEKPWLGIVVNRLFRSL